MNVRSTLDYQQFQSLKKIQCDDHLEEPDYSNIVTMPSNKKVNFESDAHYEVNVIEASPLVSNQ